MLSAHMSLYVCCQNAWWKHVCIYVCMIVSKSAMEPSGLVS